MANSADILGGAGQGAAAGTAISPGWGTAIGAGLGGLMGLFSSGKSEPGSVGYDIVNFNDPGDFAARQASQGYMMDQLAALRAGQAPAWVTDYLAQLKKQQLLDARNQMFGKEGMAGGSIADVASSAGAMQGLGGQNAMAPVNTALSNYADRLSGINQAIASYQNSFMQNAANTVPMNLANQAAPRNQIVPMNTAGAAAPNYGSLMSNVGNVDWSRLLAPKTTMPNTMTVTPQQSFGIAGALGSSGNLYDKMYSGQY